MMLTLAAACCAVVASAQALPGASSGGIALSPGGGTLYVVNPDSNSVSALDTRSNQKIAETPVGQDPRCLAVSPDGNTLYVTNQGSATLSILDARTLTLLGTVAVDAEPYGILAAPGEPVVYVAASANAIVDILRLPGISRRGPPLHAGRPSAPPIRPLLTRIPVKPKPEGLALSADGATLYATHFLSGEISAIDLATQRVVRSISTGADSNMAQKIAIHPQNGKAYLPHIRSNVSNPALLFDSTIFPVVSVVDLAAGQEIPSQRIDLSIGANSTNLPFDIAFAPDGEHGYVVNFGSGEMSVVDFARQIRVADVDVGDGPRGIAVSPDGLKAYVWNSLSNDVSVVDLKALQEIARIPVTTSPLPADVQRGKILFFSSRSSRISTQRWMSCGSCHFEGDTDGRTWMFAGSGPRNTPTVRGSAQTMPLHWSADRCQLQDFEFTIRQLQGGTGLITNGAPNPPCTASNAGLSADLDALAAYTATLQAKPSPVPLDAASVARGAAIFARPDTACAACHTRPPLYTDSTEAVVPFLKHDVGTGTSPLEQNGSAFDTPSLRMLWDTPPYLHDGSAATLMELLTTSNTGNLHGNTSQLSAQELRDLIAFLMSL